MVNNKNKEEEQPIQTGQQNSKDTKTREQEEIKIMGKAVDSTGFDCSQHSLHHLSLCDGWRHFLIRVSLDDFRFDLFICMYSTGINKNDFQILDSRSMLAK